MSTRGLDPEAVVAVLREEGSVTSASVVLKLRRNTLHSFIQRHGIDTSKGADKAVWHGESEIRQVSTTGKLGDVAGLIRRRGLNPDDFEAHNIRLNEYGKCGECGHGGLEQNRVDLKPRKDFLMPARSDGWKAPKVGKGAKTSKLWFVLSDHHCPGVDLDLHACTLAALREHQPNIVVAGDLVDYAGVSRHRKSGFEPGLNESLQSAYDILRSYRETCPNARIVFLDGNHEQRLHSALEGKGLVNVANLKRPEDEVNVLSTRHLLRLDELRVEQVFPPEGCSYEHAEFRILKDVAVRHGWIASAGSGSSALKTLDKLRRNVIIGHTHRQSWVAHTHWEDGKAKRLVAVEAGCMAIVNETGMGYAIAPDWSQGFAVVQEHSKGFTADLATYTDRKLHWRDFEYSV